MILRECLRGQTRFVDLHDKLGLGRNVLTERLTLVTSRERIPVDTLVTYLSGCLPADVRLAG